jgi:hypothetical protein
MNMNKKTLDTGIDPAPERPEVLAQFGKSARKPDQSQVARLEADRETKPIPTDNRDKHDIATTLLREGAEGETPDPKEAGVDELPDRITENRRRSS